MPNWPPLLEVPAVTIRPVRHEDGRALVAAHRAGRAMYHPWADPFMDMEGFETWFAAIESGRKTSMVAETGRRIAGLINLNEVVRGSFQSAYPYDARRGRRGGCV